MSEKDIARQIIRGYVDREIDLEDQLREILQRNSRRAAAAAEAATTVEKGDIFQIRRQRLEKQKKIARKRNETFLKELEHTTAKMRASLACDDLTDGKLDVERKKFLDHIRRTREQSV